MLVLLFVAEDHHDWLITFPASEIRGKSDICPGTEAQAECGGYVPSTHPRCVSLLPNVRLQILTLLEQFHSHQQPIQPDPPFAHQFGEWPQHVRRAVATESGRPRKLILPDQSRWISDRLRAAARGSDYPLCLALEVRLARE
jgi:hypothetical protein